MTQVNVLKDMIDFEQRILERTTHHLLWVWYTYNGYKDANGVMCLEHRNMSAGEDACDLLEEWGLVVDKGYHAEVTQKGIDLMNREWED